MRRYNGIADIGGTACPVEAVYPDDVVFCFNPLFLEISISIASGIKSLEVRFSVNASSIGTRKIIVNLYQGKARVYYSRILELFFENVKCERVKSITVTIMNGTNQIHSFTHSVVWGSLAIGERFDSYGVFKYDSQRPYLKRTRVWFKNFPFTVTMFQRSGVGYNLKARCDFGTYDSNRLLYSPMFTMMANLEEISFQGKPTDVCPVGKSLDAILYATDTNKFYGIYDDDHICGTWDTQLPFYYDSTYYNGNDGHPRTDMKWGWTGNHSFYRYDEQTSRLIQIEYGFFGDFGLFELDPLLTFPQAKTSVTYRQENKTGSIHYSTFDETFDYTFAILNEFTTITELIVNNDTAGYYLRWIDRFGCFQYYLFKSGEATIKNKLSGNTFVELAANNGMWFPNHTRDISISATDTRKCQANSIPDEIFSYVSSIITSPVIDLYLGKTKLGEEIWVPVNIVASSHKFKPKDVLHDLEISFTKPDIQAQTL